MISPRLPKPSAPKVGKKRFATPPPSDPSTLPPSPRKRVHIESDSSSGEEQGEVEEMIVDDRPMPSGTRIPGLHKRLKVKEDAVKNRKDRREKLARRTERLTKNQSQDDSLTEPVGKRKSKWVSLLYNCTLMWRRSQLPYFLNLSSPMDMVILAAHVPEMTRHFGMGDIISLPSTGNALGLYRLQLRSAT